MSRHHLSAPVLPSVKDPEPRTACGLHGEYLRDGRISDDPALVTCKRCLNTWRARRKQ